MSYFVEVWDNDGINGRKRSKTSAYQFKFPSKSELNEKIAVSAKKAEKKEPAAAVPEKWWPADRLSDRRSYQIQHDCRHR